MKSFGGGLSFSSNFFYDRNSFSASLIPDAFIIPFFSLYCTTTPLFYFNRLLNTRSTIDDTLITTTGN